MSATYDFDRLLESVLETNGPQAIPTGVVDRALANARAVGQRRPIVPAFDRRAWPRSRRLASDPARLARLGLLVLLVVLTLAFAGAVGTRLLNQPHHGPLGPIAFIRGGDLYLADADGGNTTLLLDDPGVDLTSVIGLAGGQRVAVQGGDAMSVVDIRSRRVERLGPATAEASWSAARDAYAFQSGNDGSHVPVITVVEATSGLAHEIRPDDVDPQAGYLGRIAWSPDGRSFAASATRDNALVVIDATSGSTTEVLRRGTDQDPFGYQDLAWSPDGSKIAFDTIFDDGHESVFVVDRDGGQSVELGSISLALPEARNLGRQLLPAWSPDGAWVAFKMDAGIFLARPDGSGLRDLRTGPVGPFSWSSDGSGIAFVSLAGLDAGSGELSWVSLPDGAIRRLGISSDLSFSVLDQRPTPDSSVAPASAASDGSPSAAAPTAVPSPSTGAVVLPVVPVVQTPPVAPPVDPNGIFSSALGYSTFRLGCREPFRLDLTSGASASLGGCYDLVSPAALHIGHRASEGLVVRDPDADTSVPVDAPPDAYPVAWSPDGRWLAWTATDDPSTGLPTVAGIVSADGAHQVRLPAPDAAWQTPSWSPDSSRVAIATTAGLLVGGPDGTDLRLVGSFPAPVAWAPGGDRFAYVQGGDVWMANVDGTHPTNLSRFAFGGAGAVAWSPGGGSIAVMQGHTLWFLDLNGGRHGVDLGIDAASGAGQIAWAPAGGTLAVAVGVGSTAAIDLVSSDGSRVVRVEHADGPTWSPSVRYLAFRALDPGATGIGVVNADGSGRRTWRIQGNVSVLPMIWIR